MLFTEEQLNMKIDATLTLSEIIIYRSSVKRRLKDKINNVRNMRRNGKPRHLIEFTERDIERMGKAIRTLDNLITNSF